MYHASSFTSRTSNRCLPQLQAGSNGVCKVLKACLKYRSVLAVLTSYYRGIVRGVFRGAMASPLKIPNFNLYIHIYRTSILLEKSVRTMIDFPKKRFKKKKRIGSPLEWFLMVIIGPSMQQATPVSKIMDILSLKGALKQLKAGLE